MALRKFICAIQQDGIFVIAEVHMPAVAGGNHRQTTCQSFCGRQIETFPSGRKDQHIANMVEKIHLTRPEIFRNDLDRWSKPRCSSQLFLPMRYRVFWVLNGLDDQQYRISA